MDFRMVLNRRIDMVDEALEKLLPSKNAYPTLLFEAMRYSVFAGGKRLRPVMLLSACVAVGGSMKDAEKFAAAIEMIHTYSLIHDDLPAMDNDDLRRGVPTNHKKFGENIAILAGDALLSHAMEIMAEACDEAASPKKAIKAMRIIARGAGVYGMVAGQLVDVDSEGKNIGEKTLEYIHANKTAAMIRAALQAGCVLGGGSESETEAMGVIGDKIGYAFQIQDDVLDVISSDEQLGKPSGSDEKNHKVTYVTIHGVDKAKADAQTLFSDALDILSGISGDTDFLKELIGYMAKRTK